MQTLSLIGEDNASTLQAFSLERTRLSGLQLRSQELRALTSISYSGKKTNEPTAGKWATHTPLKKQATNSNNLKPTIPNHLPSLLMFHLEVLFKEPS